jgi:crossover junction endodeoxyribonuclease RusA
MEIELPFPPSVNHYWRRVGAKTLISREGRAFREEVLKRCQGGQKLMGGLGVRIWAHPPDRRRRDLDNLLKAPLDALQHGGLFEDDYQVGEIHLHRAECVKDGKLVVELWPQEGPSACDTEDLRAELERRARELEGELASVLEALAGL